MRNRFVIILVAGLVLYGISAHLKRHSFSMSDTTEGIRIVKGDNDFLFEDGGDFNVDIRVFGFNESTYNENYGPLALITHFFIATPMAANEKIFSSQMCEKSSLKQASMVNAIVRDEQALRKIRTIEADSAARKCVRLTAKSLFLKRLLYNGEDITQGWRVTSEFHTDPYKYVLVSDIRQIDCQAL